MMRSRRKLLQTAATVCSFFAMILPHWSVAETVDRSREGCVGLYSAQKRMCSVEHVFQCEGDVIRYEEWNSEDGTSVEVTTFDGKFLSAWDDSGNLDVERVLEHVDPFSFTSLVSSGTETFEYTALVSVPFFLDPIPAEVSGTAHDQQESLAVNGTQFRRYRMEYSINLNALRISGYEDLYFDPETNTAVSGESKVQFAGTSEITEGPPAMVIKPGERGFLINDGMFDCGQLSHLDAGTLSRFKK